MIFNKGKQNSSMTLCWKIIVEYQRIWLFDYLQNRIKPTAIAVKINKWNWQSNNFVNL